MGKRKISQSKINSMVLDILEDIVGKASVHDYDVATKVAKLSTYMHFGKTIEQMEKELK